MVRFAIPGLCSSGKDGESVAWGEDTSFVATLDVDPERGWPGRIECGVAVTERWGKVCRRSASTHGIFLNRPLEDWPREIGPLSLGGRAVRMYTDCLDRNRIEERKVWGNSEETWKKSLKESAWYPLLAGLTKILNWVGTWMASYSKCSFHFGSCKWGLFLNSTPQQNGHLGFTLLWRHLWRCYYLPLNFLCINDHM